MIDLNNFTPFSSLIGGLIIGFSIILYLYTTGKLAGISGIFDNAITNSNNRFANILFLLGLIIGPSIYLLINAELGKYVSLKLIISSTIENFSELFSYQDIDSLGLPTPWFIKKIRKSNYQNMVDLNIEFNPFSSFLVRACNPEVRIGFNYDNSKKYYNVILDQNYQKDLDGTFDMIGKFIKK